jgi:hypothetical protein
MIFVAWSLKLVMTCDDEINPWTHPHPRPLCRSKLLEVYNENRSGSHQLAGKARGHHSKLF